MSPAAYPKRGTPSPTRKPEGARGAPRDPGDPQGEQGGGGAVSALPFRGAIAPLRFPQIRLVTSRPDAVAAWYETVVGTRATLDGERLGGAGPIVLTVGEPSPTRRSIDFRYASIDDLLANYLRLQLFEISPVEAALIGDQTEIRYRDPDGNGVALGYVHDCWRPAGTSAPVGEHSFDPRIVLDARKTGASVSEITSMLRRAVAAEPTGPAES